MPGCEIKKYDIHVQILSGPMFSFQIKVNYNKNGNFEISTDDLNVQYFDQVSTKIQSQIQ